jgi:Tol biopolymer transport system component
MSLATGSRLGPYEVLGLIGSGGMGEVYRARDPRLAREVAVKVLPSSFSTDPDRLRRFEQEAKAAGVLNHPNITAVYDIGRQEGSTYVVSELLEGETLRSRLAAGALPLRKVIDYARQIASGLAAAHEKGIVHRDLKPENLFVTKDGRVKILDFGLAKLTHAEDGSRPQTNLPTATAGTEPGVVLGTLGYMSPEQVRGKPADHRSDLFAFGAILYEMLSGKRAFSGDSAADTMSAILMKEPEELSATNRNIPPALDRIVRHCLEKNPEERFHSAHDLAFQLEALSEASGQLAAAPFPDIRRRPRARGLVTVIALAGAIVLGFASATLLWRSKPVAHPSFQRLTFQRGNLLTGRFGPDGETVVYAAAWEGKSSEVYSTSPKSPEFRALGTPNADLLAVSSNGELAVSLRREHIAQPSGAGTLAIVPMAGGAPRPVLEDVEDADWSPDGKQLAVQRTVQGRTRIEYPIGTLRYESRQGLRRLRISPDGKSIAFLEGNPGGWTLTCLDGSGTKRALAGPYAPFSRFAWDPSGREIWFAAEMALRAVTLSGRERILFRSPNELYLHDISKHGRVLVERGEGRQGVILGGPGGERELGWFDGSELVGLLPDGAGIVFNDRGAGGRRAFYLRRTDGSPAIRLGEGYASDVSYDGKWVLAARPETRDHLLLYPTGTGTPRTLPHASVEEVGPSTFLPDGRRVLVLARMKGQEFGLHVQDLSGGEPRPLVGRFFAPNRAASPDGKWVALIRGYSDPIFLQPLDGGQPRPVPDSQGLIPVGWTADGDHLYVLVRESVPARIERMEPLTGRREPWKVFSAPDMATIFAMGSVAISPDGRFYAYGYNRSLTSDLFLVDGLK